MSSVRSRLHSFVNEFGNNICLTNDMVVLCKKCNITVVSEKNLLFNSTLVEISVYVKLNKNRTKWNKTNRLLCCLKFNKQW